MALRLREKHRGKKAIPRRASTEVSHKSNLMAALCPQDRPAYVTACLLYVRISVCGQLGLRQTSRPISCSLRVLVSGFLVCVCVCMCVQCSCMLLASISVVMCTGMYFQQGAALDMCTRVTTSVHASLLFRINNVR